MKKEYVFLDLKNYNNTKYIECIKMDNKFNRKDILKQECKNEETSIKRLINFLDRTVVIGYDLQKLLINLLQSMYELKIYNCTFYYFDMKDYLLDVTKIESISEMINLMKVYSNNNLDNIKYIKNKPNYVAFRVFRGLDYKLYLLDKGYYMYDKSLDKTASFYVHQKELAKEGSYTEDEYVYLKNHSAHFITNIFHISNDTIKYTTEYTIYSNNNLAKYKYMIDAMKNALLFLKQHSSLNIKLVCIGTIEELKENYKILGKENVNTILKLITREKELWSNW